METRSPSLHEFLETGRRAFGFLVEEFGFVEAAHARNPFGLQYRRGPLLLTVEGINWGFGVQVLFVPLENEAPVHSQAVPLWAVAKVRCGDELEVAARASGQLEQLQSHATMLRKCASDVLLGDFTVFSDARKVFPSQ
jgi:hypothetical protein